VFQSAFLETLSFSKPGRTYLFISCCQSLVHAAFGIVSACRVTFTKLLVVGQGSCTHPRGSVEMKISI
jgi:hypothetical protein